MKEIEKQLDAARKQTGSDLIAHRDCGWCTTLELKEDGKKDTYWIQLHDGQINFQYLHGGHPGPVFEERGVQLPEGAGEPDWQDKLYCTLDVTKVSDSEIVALVKGLASNYYGLGEEAKVSSSLEELY